MNRIYDRFAPNRIIVTPGLPAEGSDDGAEAPPQPVLSPEAVPLLEELLGFYEQLAREGSENPRLRSQAAEAEQRIGDIRQRLGQLEPAIAAYRKAITLHGKTDGEPEASRIRVARTYNELGRALRALQRTDEAREAHGQAYATLAGASAESTRRPEYRYELARTYYFQSRREPMEGPPEPPGPDRGRGRGRPPGLDDPGRGPPPPFAGRGGHPPAGPGDGPPRQRAIRLLEELVKEHRSVPEYRHLLACCYRDGPPSRPGRGAPADPASDPAVELLRQLVKDFPKVPDYRYDLCETLARLSFPGRAPPPESAPAARALLGEALALSRGLTQEYPNVPLYAAAHASVHDRLGVLLHQLKELEEAEKSLRKAIELESSLAARHPEVEAYGYSLALMQSSLARVLADRGSLNEARGQLEASTQRLVTILIKDQRLGSARQHLGRGLRELAQVLKRLGDEAGAADALRKAELLGPAPGPFGPR
jgi:tetratricopeptide (TPR) repeat protein